MIRGGFVRLADLTTLRICGTAARDFLSRQLTCDITTLAPSTSLFGAWLTPKGRAVALMYLLDAGDGTLRAVLPAELAEDVVRRLSLFIMRDDVSITRADHEVVLGLIGQAAQSAAMTQSFAIGAIVLGGDPPLTILVAGGDAAQRAMQSLASTEVEELERTQWELAQVRAGLPTILAATREAFIPQMLNLDRLGAVSFHKGCYPGQEIVARTQHLGRIKRRTFVTHCDERVPAAAPGDPVMIAGSSAENAGGGSAGRVMRAVCHQGGQDMLVVLPLDAVRKGARFRLVDGPELQVSPPPYALDDTAP